MKKITPKIADVVENREQARVAVSILLSKIEVEFREYTFREMDPEGVARGAYDHHGYPTMYDLDDVGMTRAEGFKDHGALELADNPKKLRELVYEELAKCAKV